ncbi:uncharacterized protein [Ambystoma mexicanum]|uniref:uncharacterized protein n=1 Tax=Ambystoma mexicanum TaxID=8296 RepID=UPI0037E76343
MDRVFSDMLFLFVIVHLGDILIFSKDPLKNEEHVKAVLQRLREHKLLAKPEKCIFHASTVHYLGFVLSPEGIGLDQSKVKAILSWPSPTTVKQIQSFLGLANLYRKFIPSFSEIVQPIIALLKKDAPFLWTTTQEEAFQRLQTEFTQAPILAQPDINRPFIVETDASNYAIGAVLNSNLVTRLNILSPTFHRH